MKKLTQNIRISASPEQVWDCIINLDKYRTWTSAFNPGSYFEGGWNKGDKILFLAKNDKGEPGGMVSEIAESIYPNHISILHRGMVANGVEDTESDEVKKWAPAYENYQLETDGNTTLFTVNMDLPDEYFDMFEPMWQNALILLKQTAE